MVQEYLSKIFKKYKTRDASERTYYPVLEQFLSSFVKSGKNISVLVESRNSSLGIPDFRVDNEKHLLLGYIEAKDLGRDLDRLTSGEDKQIERYIKEYPKLIVTNFIEFRLYEDGKEVEKVLITQPVALKITIPVLINEGKFLGMLERFLASPMSRIYTSKKLAELLAWKTHVLRDLIREEINLSDEKTTPTEELLEVFKKTLRSDINEDDFADMYAQTVTYGLFSARLNAGEKDFNRLTAPNYIPTTIPLLKRIFFLISGQDISQHIKWQADEIAEILANTNIEKIQHEFFKQGKGRDPIIHFYETFLSEYDPKERAKKGVYYTPEPVVSYITQSVHKLLKYKFGKIDGFADNSVTVLDPAAGTLTFLASAIAIAKEEYVKRYGSGGWETLVKEHILKDFYAFEILMAPYTVGHLKISLLLKESGYELQEHDRFKLYLTNTLNFGEIEELPLLMLAKEITEESKNAYDVKTKEPVLVITGNPPYSVSSSNVIEKGSDFYELYESYKEIVRKQEANIQPLSDDYIKFIAFAHWKVKQTGQGIVGMITNNSYLDGLIHRDMRKKLLGDFNEIYILNLHGSLKRQEKTPQGSKDENVFDIQQGVSIVLLVKNNNINKTVKYADQWGLREEKYKFLGNSDVYKTNWIELDPTFPNNFFVPKDFSGSENYEKFISLKVIFKSYNAGVATGKDSVLVDFDKQALDKRFSTFDKNTFELLMESNGINQELIDKWFNESKRINIQEEIRSYSYRPFDKRYVIYNKQILQRARYSLMKNFLQDNLGLISLNTIKKEKLGYFFVSDAVTDRHILDLSADTAYLFPLYIYNNEGQQSLLDKKSRAANFNWNIMPPLYQTTQPFVSKLTGNFIQAEEAIFYYIYAILYSNIYRKKYKEFLKIDFPKIPFTQDYELFKALAQRGEQLSQLHLLKSKDLENPIAKFYRSGSNEIKKVKFIEADQVGPEIDFPRLDYLDSEEGGPGFKKRGVIVINEENQFFGPINEDVWNYYIGGYHVLDKWLKSRKDRLLSSEEIKDFCRIITSISKTIEIQKEIDRLYLKVEGDL